MKCTVPEHHKLRLEPDNDFEKVFLLRSFGLTLGKWGDGKRQYVLKPLVIVPVMGEHGLALEISTVELD